MTSLAHPLLLAACTLALAGAASLPAHIDDATPIRPTPHQNKLRAEPVDIIPVEVVLEEVDPSIRANEVVDEEDAKRPQVDLRNPGPPQRQEHETQNPEHYSEDALRVATIKETIEQTRNLLKQGFQGISEDIQNWDSSEDQLKIQSNIQNFRSTFVAQIKKLDDSLHALAQPQDSAVSSDSRKSHIKSDVKNVESLVNTLRDNFNNGVDTLFAGVNLVGALKSDQDQERQESAAPAAPAAPVPAPAPAPAQPQNIISQYLTTLNNAISQSFSNFTTGITSFISNGQATTPAGAQADQGEATTSGPIQFFPQIANAINNVASNVANFLNPSQQNASPTTPSPPGLFQQFFFGTNPTPAAVAPAPAASGTAQIIEVKKPEVTVAANPEPADKPAAPAEQAAPPAPQAAAPEAPPAAAQPAAPLPAQPAPTPAPEGPIRQILNNNPVVQSIAGAVQRITNSITNPERPRETEDKKEDAATKGGFFYARPPNHGSGDNNDVGSSGVIETVQEEDKPIQEELQKEEVKPEAVPEKTE